MTTRTYVRTIIVSGTVTVAEVITTDLDIHALYHPDFVAALIDVTDHDPMPGEWWTYDGETFAPPVAPSAA